jgi:hypothetical protein
MQNDEEHVSDGQVAYLVSLVREGKSDPADTRALLQEFIRRVDQGDQGKPIPAALREYIRDAFRAYLANNTPLDVSLGLKRKGRGPPKKVGKEAAALIAFSLWECRLRNVSHQEALEQIGARWDIGTTMVGKIWREFAQDGLDIMITMRQSWSAKKRQLLREICSDNKLTVPKFAREP